MKKLLLILLTVVIFTGCSNINASSNGTDSSTKPNNVQTTSPTLSPTIAPTPEPTLEPTPTPSANPKKLKKEASSITFKKLGRNPNKYIGENFKVTGEVIQVMKEDNYYILRINITKTDWGYDDTIIVEYTAEDGDDNILEDDIVNVYGYCLGEYTYESTLGSSITLPAISAYAIDIK